MSIQDVQQAYNRFKGLLTEYQELMKPEPAHEVAAAPAVPAPVDEAVPLHLSAAVAEVAAPTVAPVAEAAAVEAAVAAATAADEAEEAGLEAAAAAPPVEGGDLEEELLDAGEVVAADPAAVAAAAAPAIGAPAPGTPLAVHEAVALTESVAEEAVAEEAQVLTQEEKEAARQTKEKELIEAAGALAFAHYYEKGKDLNYNSDLLDKLLEEVNKWEKKIADDDLGLPGLTKQETLVDKVKEAIAKGQKEAEAKLKAEATGPSPLKPNEVRFSFSTEKGVPQVNVEGETAAIKKYLQERYGADFKVKMVDGKEVFIVPDPPEKLAEIAGQVKAHLEGLPAGQARKVVDWPPATKIDEFMAEVKKARPAAAASPPAASASPTSSAPSAPDNRWGTAINPSNLGPGSAITPGYTPSRRP